MMFLEYSCCSYNFFFNINNYYDILYTPYSLSKWVYHILGSVTGNIKCINFLYLYLLDQHH